MFLEFREREETLFPKEEIMQTAVQDSTLSVVEPLQEDSLSEGYATVSFSLAREIISTHRTDTIAIDSTFVRYVETNTVDNLYSFDLDSIAQPDTLAMAEVKGMSAYSLDNQKTGLDLPQVLGHSEGLFALLVICFLLLSYFLQGGIDFFRQNAKMLISPLKREKLEDQIATSKSTFSFYFLVFLAILLIAIFVYIGLRRFTTYSELYASPFVIIVLFTVLIALFVFVKVMVNKMIGYVFDTQKKMDIWNHSFLLLLAMLGLVYLVPALILIYAGFGHGVILALVTLLFLVVQILLLARIVTFFIRQRFSILFLIAYLCTLEIIPYIFLGVGLVYLYKIDVFNMLL